MAKEAEAERRRALFAGEDKSYKLLKDKLSSLWERDLCEGGDSMADSGEMASEEETKLLKRLTAFKLENQLFHSLLGASSIANSLLSLHPMLLPRYLWYPVLAWAYTWIQVNSRLPLSGG